MNKFLDCYPRAPEPEENSMNEDSLLKQTLKWIGGLLGASLLWVGGLSLVALGGLHLALGSSPASPQGAGSPATTTTTPAAKPASSVAPSKGSEKAPEDPPAKRRFG